MNTWKRIILASLSFLAMGLAPVGAALAQVKVTAATPASAYQGTWISAAHCARRDRSTAGRTGSAGSVSRGGPLSDGAMKRPATQSSQTPPNTPIGSARPLPLDSFSTSGSSVGRGGRGGRGSPQPRVLLLETIHFALERIGARERGIMIFAEAQ